MGGKQNSSTFKVFQGAYEPCNSSLYIPDVNDSNGWQFAGIKCLQISATKTWPNSGLHTALVQVMHVHTFAYKHRHEGVDIECFARVDHFFRT